MKKAIILLIIFFGTRSFVKSQTFIQGSLGMNIFEVSQFVGDKSKGGKKLDFQIGKFVNDRKMRAFVMAYKFGTKYTIDEQNYSVYDPISGSYDRYRYTPSVSSSEFSFGYERKVTFANTEFDDPWQFYNIITYRLCFGTIKDNTVYPANANKDEYAGSYVDFSIDLGLGMARKFSVKTYAFAELRYNESIFYSIGFSTNVGVRHFIR